MIYPSYMYIYTKQKGVGGGLVSLRATIQHKTDPSQIYQKPNDQIEEVGSGTIMEIKDGYTGWQISRKHTKLGRTFKKMNNY